MGGSCTLDVDNHTIANSAATGLSSHDISSCPGVDPVMHGILKGMGFLRHCEPTGRANARPMTGSAKQSIGKQEGWIASSLRSSQ
jgi:hypothetical protein